MELHEAGPGGRSGAIETLGDEVGEALCARPHPLLDNVSCQRMRGHPGRHGALVDTSSAEITLSWDVEDPADAE